MISVKQSVRPKSAAHITVKAKDKKAKRKKVKDLVSDPFQKILKTPGYLRATKCSKNNKGIA